MWPPILLSLVGVILVVLATLSWRNFHVKNEQIHLETLLCIAGAVISLFTAMFMIYDRGQTSIASRLQNGEEAKVLAVIPAADSLVINKAFKPPAKYNYVLVLKNKENKERRELWEKADTVRVGDKIGRLESGLILVQTANTGSVSLATR